MNSYRAPIEDLRFLVFDVLGLPESLPAGDALDRELIGQVIEEAGRFCAGVLAPLNASGDREACTLADGEVRTPQGFPAAYKAYCDGGWAALACDPELGGQGLPIVLRAALDEMMAASNHAFTMYPGLAHGAYEALRHHGSDALKARFLPNIVSGEWLATMCLTEPQAGSDLGQIRTMAQPRADGSWSITGTKIFISGGEHDLTENIVHLVLARTPDAPPGTRGLSLFVAPKHLDDGRRSDPRNAIRCEGLEHKMGIRASATCVMRFEQAQGWMIGEPHRGLAAMFLMMNAARLHVGMQGLGHAEAALQLARAYAAERRQGRAGAGAGPDLLSAHPSVQRLIADQRALVEGGRALALWTAYQIDVAETSGDAEARQRADALLALLTPVVKAFLTELGSECADRALQVFGGYGFMVETGVEQHLRDARIARIYEGTNEIQALDLLRRKVLGDGGATLARFVEEMRASADAAPGEASTRADSTRALADELLGLSQWLGTESADDAMLPARVAGEFLRLTGLAALAMMWLKIEAAAARRADDEPMARSKRALSMHYFDYVLPQAHACAAIVRKARTPTDTVFAGEP
ncbi:MAG: acyl-CoA dehydrogenase family protein [Burkholderiaceae bacterium]